MRARILTIIGLFFYLVWAGLHIQAGHAVAKLGRAQHHSMVQARLYQDAWMLYFAAGTVAVVSLVAIFLDWQPAYWVNLGVAFITDSTFIVFVLKPHYMALWPGLQGPLAWAGGLIFSTAGLVLGGKALHGPQVEKPRLSAA